MDEPVESIYEQNLLNKITLDLRNDIKVNSHQKKTQHSIYQSVYILFEGTI